MEHNRKLIEDKTSKDDQQKGKMCFLEFLMGVLIKIMKVATENIFLFSSILHLIAFVSLLH